MINVLKIWDFDGTLINTPSDTPENKRLYEKATGIPWNISKEQAVQLSRKLKRTIHPRRGWWGRNETLLPPLVPDPVPESMWIKDTMDALLKSMQEDCVLNIILTGRHVGMRQNLLRILGQGGFTQVMVIPSKDGDRYEWLWDDHLRLHLLGDDGPCPDMVGIKPQETFPWKVWIIQQYWLEFPKIKTIEIWEDRDEHVVQFKALEAHFQDLDDLIVHHVR